MTKRVPQYLFSKLASSVLAVLAVTTSTAYGCCESEAQARDALRAGQFGEAANAAQQLGTIEARLIAAEALSAQVLLGTAQDGKDTAKAAQALAESVLLEEPSNLEAQFQYALADGFVTRATSPFSAWRKKLPQKTKEIVDSYIYAAPEDGRGYALRGAWHLGILRKTGEKNGAKWFGADLIEGQAAYAEALRLRPNDVIISANYAMSMAELDYEANGVWARAMLNDVDAASPSSAAEREVQARISEILLLWDNEDAVLDRIEQFLDGDG